MGGSGSFRSGQKGAQAAGREFYDQDHTDDEEHEGAPGIQDVADADDDGKGQPGAHDGAEEYCGSPHYHGGRGDKEQPRENSRLDGRT